MTKSILNFLKTYYLLFFIILLGLLFFTHISELYVVQGYDFPFKQLLILKIGVILFSFFVLILYFKTDKVSLFVIGWGLTLLLAFCIVSSGFNPFTIPYSDYWYMNALVSKYKYYNTWLVDSTIKDIPSYIAPLYFFVLGKIAQIFNLESYQVLIFGSWVGILAVPSLTYYLLKDRFEHIIVILSIISISVFFEYEIRMKPYQTISALIALIFYYKIICNNSFHLTVKNIFIGVIFGITLFLFYYHCFVYLAIAFALKLSVLLYKKASWKGDEFKKQLFNFYIYILVFVLAFFTFLMPHIIAVAKSGSSNSIFFLATQQFNFPAFEILISIGLIQLFSSFNKSDSANTLIIFFSIVILCLANLFAEYFINGDLAVIKIYHLYILIVIPYTIQFIYNFIIEKIGKNDLKLLKGMYMVLISSFTVYSLNHWVEKCYNKEQANNSFIDYSKAINSEIDFKNKVVFNTYFHGGVEIGAFGPAFYFAPINVDYASPASRIEERIKLIESFRDIKNPAEFAYKIYNNNIQNIDYINWDNMNRFCIYKTYRMGESPQMIEFHLDKRLLSFKYFNKLNSKYDIYSKTYDSSLNFSNQKATLLEKMVKDTTNIYGLKEFKNHIISNPQNYLVSDLLDLRFYLEQTQNIDSVKLFEQFIANNILLNSQWNVFFRLEAENLGSNIPDNDQKFIVDNNCSNYKFLRAKPEHGNQTLMYGPYSKLSKGKYKIMFKIRVNSKGQSKLCFIDIVSNQKDKADLKVYNAITLNGDDVYNSSEFKLISLQINIEEDFIEGFQTRILYLGNNYTLDVDFVDILPL